jgi:diguanylate cyclase (GGDEF)-like protein
MTSTMDADEILRSLRTVVLVCDDVGLIVNAAGGFGGFFGLDVPTLPGTSVFEYLIEKDARDLATYLVESVAGLVAMPMPFRVSLIDEAGLPQPVDIIASGRPDEAGRWWWTAVIVPVALSGSISRSFDLEMKGASRDRVRRMLCEELLVDNEALTSRWLLIDLDVDGTPSVETARDSDLEIAELAEASIALHNWKPWELAGSTTAYPLEMSSVPEPLAGLLRIRNWNRAVVSPVHLDGVLVAAFLMVGRVSSEYPAGSIQETFVARTRTLVEATALLLSRWRDQDRLVVSATCDSMTGLANRESFFAALDSERRTGALLYIDIDHFKSVNDHYGHEVGDRVIRETARRITEVCRQDDLVARFGGDEFVVLLRHATLDTARTIATRVIEAASAPLTSDGPETVSVSVGLAMLVNGANPVDAADQAMLSAKRNGRGRLEMALVSSVS